MTVVHVTKFKGSQGSWEAEVTYSDGSKEVLACVHKHYFKRDADASTITILTSRSPNIFGAQSSPNRSSFRSKGRVILTADDVDESKELDIGAFKRTGYVAVYPISDFVIDDAGMRFRFGNPIRPR